MNPNSQETFLSDLCTRRAVEIELQSNTHLKHPKRILLLTRCSALCLRMQMDTMYSWVGILSSYLQQVVFQNVHSAAEASYVFNLSFAAI